MLQTIKELTRWAEELSKLELVQEIDQLQAAVDSHRPISREIQDRIFQKFRLEWNYNSNAIEGNNLTYGETVALIMHGVTAKGKPLKDHLDVKGHNKGINLLLDIVKSERDFTQNDIRSLHEIILVESYSSKTVTLDGIPATRKIQIGQYKTVPNHVRTVTGEMHYYATPEETPILMDELMDWYEQAKTNDKIHPFILASLFHYRFVAIHPFDDGNGRMTRILMNLILMRNQYPPIVVPLKLREQYYGVLSEADSEDYLPMIEYFGELLKHSLGIQLKGIKGESIAEPDDIDKKIELLKITLNSKGNIERRDKKNIWKITNNQIYPLFEQFHLKCSKLNDLFEKNSYYIRAEDSNKDNYINRSLSFDELKLMIQTPAIVFEKLEIIYEWRDFKKHVKSFDLVTSIKFEFKDTFYTYKLLGGDNDNEIQIPYNKRLTKKELNHIIMDRISIILNKIEKYTTT